MQPLVSIITPTFGREEYLAQTLRWVRAQTYPCIEWLILDDSPAPAALFGAVGDPRIRYQHIDHRLTIGEKRNRLIERAQGEYIAHFDDDDYYAPRFLETVISQLEGGAGDFANLNSWYLFDLRHDFFGYWNLKRTTGLHFQCFANTLRLKEYTPQNNATLANNYLGYGFTYVYRRRVWEATPFAALDWGEDGQFVHAAAARFQVLSLGDQSGLVLHVLHAKSTSSCFPQYQLPTFLVPTLFGPCCEFLGSLRRKSLGAA